MNTVKEALLALAFEHRHGSLRPGVGRVDGVLKASTGAHDLVGPQMAAGLGGEAAQAALAEIEKDAEALRRRLLAMPLKPWRRWLLQLAPYLEPSGFCAAEPGVQFYLQLAALSCNCCGLAPCPLGGPHGLNQSPVGT